MNEASRHSFDPNKVLFQKGTDFPKRLLLNSAGESVGNDDFDRGKSEQLKTKRIGRSRNITISVWCTGHPSCTTPSGRDEGCEKQSP